MKNDAELRNDVLDELDWEPSVVASDIGVSAHNAVVTLTGKVTTYSEKLAAERAVERVKGVRGIANEIEVAISHDRHCSDADLAEAAITALQWKSCVPDERIKVVVDKGWITLEGNVDWYYQKEEAEEAVRVLKGVRGVINQIAVTPRTSAPEVKTRIEAAFRRRAEEDAKKIRVEAHDGKVILRGELPTLRERQEASWTAWSAPGVTQVENLITISP